MNTYKFWFYLDDKIVKNKSFKSDTFDNADYKAEQYMLKENFNHYISHSNLTNIDLEL